MSSRREIYKVDIDRLLNSLKALRRSLNTRNKQAKVQGPKEKSLALLIKKD